MAGKLKTKKVIPRKIAEDTFRVATESLDEAKRQLAIIGGLRFDETNYEYSDSFVPAKELSVNTVHTTPEVIGLLKKDKTIEIEGKILEFDFSRKEYRFKKITNRESFLKVLDKNEKKFKEGFDLFAMDSDPIGGSGTGLVGQDFTPLIGGPFGKQLYQYDYIRMHMNCFFAYHHDPIARAVVNIITHFVLGRGFDINVDEGNEDALVYFDAFKKANDFDKTVEDACRELSIYGEIMPWFLPNNMTSILYQPTKSQIMQKGLIPRLRLLDPSAIYEIVTWPEDIKKVLYYQYVAPTQYQVYTAPNVPTSKFIFQQIPADQVIHYKINCVSNEKRGRSDLFPVLGYLKRLRDSVNYRIISDQKNAAWSIDTTIEGSQQDINNYIEAMKALGTIPEAGSEFVHSKKVERKYNANAGGKSSQSESFQWCLSMISAGTGIPIGYLGTHLSGGSTRASALVATEPIAKMIEARQLVMEKFISDIFFRVTGKTCEVTFPEVITQDSASKIQNISLAEQEKAISHKRMSELIAKELNITEYDYDIEQDQIAKEQKKGVLSIMNPLTTSPLLPPNNTDSSARPSAITGKDKAGIKKSNGY